MRSCAVIALVAASSALASCVVDPVTTFSTSLLTAITVRVPYQSATFFNNYVDISSSTVPGSLFTLNVSGFHDRAVFPFSNAIFALQGTELDVTLNNTLPSVSAAALARVSPPLACSLLALHSATSLDSPQAALAGLLALAMALPVAHAGCRIPILINIAIGLPSDYVITLDPSTLGTSALGYLVQYVSNVPTRAPTLPTPKPTGRPTVAPTTPICNDDAECTAITGNNSFCELRPGNHTCYAKLPCSSDVACNNGVYSWCPLSLNYCVGRFFPRGCDNSTTACLGAANGYCSNSPVDASTLCHRATSCTADAQCILAWCPANTNTCTVRNSQPGACHTDADCGGSAAGYCYVDPNFPECLRRASCIGDTDCNGGNGYAKCTAGFCTAGT